MANRRPKIDLVQNTGPRTVSDKNRFGPKHRTEDRTEMFALSPGRSSPCSFDRILVRLKIALLRPVSRAAGPGNTAIAMGMVKSIRLQTAFTMLAGYFPTGCYCILLDKQ
ncbi:hypothetical protein Tco_0245615, partial [Tanacetum coccineum]